MSVSTSNPIWSEASPRHRRRPILRGSWLGGPQPAHVVGLAGAVHVHQGQQAGEQARPPVPGGSRRRLAGQRLEQRLGVHEDGAAPGGDDVLAVQIGGAEHMGEAQQAAGAPVVVADPFGRVEFVVVRPGHPAVRLARDDGQSRRRDRESCSRDPSQQAMECRVDRDVARLVGEAKSRGEAKVHDPPPAVVRVGQAGAEPGNQRGVETERIGQQGPVSFDAVDQFGGGGDPLADEDGSEPRDDRVPAPDVSPSAVEQALDESVVGTFARSDRFGPAFLDETGVQRQFGDRRQVGHQCTIERAACRRREDRRQARRPSSQRFAR